LNGSILVAAGVAVCGAGAHPASSFPPTSVEQQTASALVSFTERRLVVTGCTLHSKPKKRCEPSTRPLAARAVVALTPVRDDRVLTKSDPRKPMRVSLGGTPGPTSVRLVEGVWNLDWRDTGVSSKIRVDDGDDFSIGLDSTTGSCTLDDDHCRLVTDSIVRTLDVPNGHRAAR
jgi:hypothetical protein